MDSIPDLVKVREKGAELGRTTGVGGSDSRVQSAFVSGLLFGPIRLHQETEEIDDLLNVLAIFEDDGRRRRGLASPEALHRRTE